MGYDLRNRNGNTFHYNTSGWSNVLHTAAAYGWEPAGTTAPEHFNKEEFGMRVWDGSYFDNDFPTVTDQDAANIADALEKAIPDIEKATLDSPAYLHRYYERYPYPNGNFNHLKRFIEFCREGGFTIG